MSMKETLAKSAEGYPLLGYVLTWTTGTDFQVKFDTFLKAMHEVGMPTEIATEVKAKSALVRAIRAETKGKPGMFHRNVVDDESMTGFAIVNTGEVDVKEVDVNFETASRVILNKGTQSVEVKGQHGKAIKESYENFKDVYTGERFRNVIIKYIFGYCDGISVRDRGGVYFIPAHKIKEFHKLEALFDRFPKNSLSIIPIIDTKQAKKTMWKTLVGDVQEEIQTLQEDFAKMDDKASTRSIDARVEKYKRLKEKVERYEDLLSGTATDLKTDLNKLSKAILTKMA